jgi:hypothetical protein
MFSTALSLNSFSNIKILCAQSFLIFIFCFMLCNKLKISIKLTQILFKIIVANNIMIIISPENFFLNLNTSTEGTFLALTFPLMWHSKSKFFIILHLIATILTTSSIGIFGILIFLLVSTFNIYYLLLVPISYLFIGNQLFSSSERWQNWVLFFNWHNENVSTLFGAGLGSYNGLCAYIQMLSGMKHNLFPNAHSDLLQIYMETGLIGIILLLISILSCIYRVKDKLQVFAISSLILFTMTCNMPLRYPFTCIAIMFYIAFIKNNKS